MVPPPPSQPSKPPKSTIFTNPDGTPICVFTQADLVGRSKVLKDLRANSAELCSSAANAQIMLVSADTDQGKQFMRDWGNDDNKTVLDYAWVKKSLTAGRPLLESDRWGDCLVEDDGAPIGGGDQDEDLDVPNRASPNPLPTPRVTPDELAKMHSNSGSSRQPSMGARSQVDDTSMPLPTPSPAFALNGGLTISTDMLPSSHPSASGVSPIGGMNPAMYMQNPAAAMGMNMNPNNMPQMQPGMMAQMMMAMFGPAMMQNPANFQQMPFMLALQDAMKNHGMAGYTGGPQPQPPMFTNTQTMSPIQEPPLPFPAPPSTSKTQSSFRSGSPILEAPSRCESSSSDSVSLRSSLKGKAKQRRASSPSSKRRKVSTSEADMKSEAPSSSMGPPLGKRIFTKKSGRQLCFFVQIEIHNRFNIVSSIKKNGGQIVDSPAASDYVILSQGNGNNRHKICKELLLVAKSAGKPAVSQKFVSDSVEQKRLLDHESYLFEPDPTRKRKRSTTGVSDNEEDDADLVDRKEAKRLQKNAREAERRRIKILDAAKEEQILKAAEKKIKAPRSASKTHVKASDKHPAGYPRRTDGPRTPTPPPAHLRVTWGQGFKFSQRENDYALRFAKIIIDRDHTVSQSTVTTVLQKKMPHHTLNSWRTHFATIANDWDMWRKRSAIAYRKAQSQKEVIASTSTPTTPTWTSAVTDAFEESPVAGPSTISTEPQQNSQDLEDDINMVVQFFVDGNDNDQSESEAAVWNRLSAKAQCKTEARWEEFYDKHSAEVINRFNAAG